MDLKWMLAAAVSFSQVAHAIPAHRAAVTEDVRTVVAVQGGYSYISANNRSQAFIDSGGNSYIYVPAEAGHSAANWGLLAGSERSVPYDLNGHLFRLQIGFEYNNFEDIEFTGRNSVGISPALTNYNYSYRMKAHQMLGRARLMTLVREHYYPYLEAGLGMALLRSHSYAYTTNETGALNLTADFDKKNTAKFSFALGIGIDKEISTKFRAGVGYRFSHLGSAPLGNGAIDLGVNEAAVSFRPSTGSLYTSQVLVHMSYLS